MSDRTPPIDTPPRPEPVRMAGPDGLQVLKLHAEALVVAKRVRKTLVRATRTTRTRQEAVEQDLVREDVIMERVPVNREVDAVPPIRQEGDVTIMPVVEEILVRRLILKEEIHLRRVRTTERHTEAVTLRDQDVAVTRTEIEA